MLFKIEPSGEKHVKDPLLGDDEIIVCSNAQEEAHIQRVANKMFFFYCLKDVRGKSFSLSLKRFLVGHIVFIHY